MGKLVAQVAGGGGVSEAQPKRLRTRLESLADYVVRIPPIIPLKVIVIGEE